MPVLEGGKPKHCSMLLGYAIANLSLAIGDSATKADNDSNCNLIADSHGNLQLLQLSY